MACSRACGERFSHLTMTTTAKGFKGQFVCMDREACLQRQLSGGGAMERDPPSMALGSAMLNAVLLPGEVALFSAEDRHDRRGCLH